MVPTSRLTALRNGVTLPYVAQGDPSGIPVVLLHGFTDSWRSFEGVLRHLPRSIRAYAVTQRGHGDADRPATGYHPDDFVADVVAFMDSVGIESAVVVGHSMGSAIARRFAARHPERVLSLVLMGGFMRFDDKPDLVELCRAVEALEDPVDPEFVRQFQLENIARPVPEDWIDMVVGESLKLPARLWREILGELVADDDTGELGRISAPTLVAWGDRDVFALREDQDAIVAAIPGAELVVYRGGGHAFQWEDPFEFAADLSAFVKTTAGRAIVGR
jgi:pimeloyl-ACP methyl ester carboxylesterase